MEYAPGDIVFVRGTGFFDKLIQFGQSLRYPSVDSYYNHVAIIVAENGNVVEAASHGVQLANLSKYADCKIVSTDMSLQDRKEAVNFAVSRLHDGYGWTTITSTVICLLFGLQFSFGFNDEDICSGLVARCLERGQSIFPRDPRHMTPADLYTYYNRK